MKTIRVVAALVERDGRYLITQRRETAVLPLLWDFPGGRVEDGESDEAALAREVRERLGATVEVGQLISFVNHPYEKYAVDLYLYECRLLSDHLIAVRSRSTRGSPRRRWNRTPSRPVDEASMSKLLGVG